MTSINFKIDEEKKKLIEEITNLKGYKSVSEFIREAIKEKLNIEHIIDDFKKKNPPLDISKIEIPEFIPDGKYLGISRNSIVVVGDSLEEVTNKLYEKFPDSAAGIIRKGNKVEKFEVIFSLFTAENTKCFQQAKIEKNFYPLLKISLINNDNSIPLLGLVDTGASLIALDESIKDQMNINSQETRKIYTAKGIIDAPIYSGKFQYENKIFELNFITMNLSGPLPIKALIGKNFIDKFNLLFLGNDKIFCIQKLNKLE